MRDGLQADAHPLGVHRFVLAGDGQDLLRLHGRQMGGSGSGLEKWGTLDLWKFSYVLDAFA